MARKKTTPKSKQDWKELALEDSDWLRGLVQQVVQEVLEAEMDEALQAGKGERTAATRRRRARVAMVVGDRRLAPSSVGRVDLYWARP